MFVFIGGTQVLKWVLLHPQHQRGSRVDEQSWALYTRLRGLRFESWLSKFVNTFFRFSCYCDFAYPIFLLDEEEKSEIGKKIETE